MLVAGAQIPLLAEDERKFKIVNIRPSKLDIVIPQIELQDTPLGDAIEYLRQKSIELDDIEADPSLKGVNIVLLHSVQDQLRKEGDILINFHARQMKLGTVLAYVAQIAGYRADAQDDAVVIGDEREIYDLRQALGLTVSGVEPRPSVRARTPLPVRK